MVFFRRLGRGKERRTFMQKQAARGDRGSNGRMRAIAADWRQSSYYVDAEQPDWLDIFWGEASVFRRLFDTLNRRALVELACGRGRHTAFILMQPDYADLGRIHLLDVNEENTSACRQRFVDHSKVSIHTSSGCDLQPIADRSATGIFCYDAMVHFEYDTVIAYIQDAWRVLQPGGCALFHHSNYDQNPGASYQDNPDWRNFMSRNLFAHVAMLTGFTVIEQIVMDWAQQPATDCVSLIEKPRA